MQWLHTERTFPRCLRLFTRRRKCNHRSRCISMQWSNPLLVSLSLPRVYETDHAGKHRKKSGDHWKDPRCHGGPQPSALNTDHKHTTRFFLFFFAANKPTEKKKSLFGKAGIVKLIYNAAYATDERAQEILFAAGIEVVQCGKPR